MFCLVVEEEEMKKAVVVAKKSEFCVYEAVFTPMFGYKRGKCLVKGAATREQAEQIIEGLSLELVEV